MYTLIILYTIIQNSSHITYSYKIPDIESKYTCQQIAQNIELNKTLILQNKILNPFEIKAYCEEQHDQI